MADISLLTPKLKEFINYTTRRYFISHKEISNSGSNCVNIKAYGT